MIFLQKPPIVEPAKRNKLSFLFLLFFLFVFSFIIPFMHFLDTHTHTHRVISLLSLLFASCFFLLYERELLLESSLSFFFFVPSLSFFSLHKPNTHTYTHRRESEKQRVRDAEEKRKSKRKRRYFPLKHLVRVFFLYFSGLSRLWVLV
jgi:polyferredoxin